MGRSDCFGSTFGTTFESKRWLSLDGCGIICIILSFSLHFFALIEIAIHLIDLNVVSHILFWALYIPCFILAITSLFMAWITNPGAVPMGARPLNVLDPDLESAQEGYTRDVTTGEIIRLNMPRGIRRCHKCNDNYKPTRAHHDSATGRCIVKMDHYCPWVCNAVGALNHKFFLLFLLYTFLTSCVSFILISMGAIRCGINYDDDDDSDSSNNANNTSSYAPAKAAFIMGYASHSSSSLSSSFEEGSNNDDDEDDCDRILTPEVMILFFVTVTFFVFTLCMICEQKEVILTNKGKIARMKIRAGKADEKELGRVTNDFNEVFGGDSPNFALHWLLPLPVRFPEGMRDVVLGYEWDPNYVNIYETPDNSTLGTNDSKSSPCPLAPIPSQSDLIDEGEGKQEEENKEGQEKTSLLKNE